MPEASYTNEQVQALTTAEIQTMSRKEIGSINRNGQVPLLSNVQLNAANERLETLGANFRLGSGLGFGAFEV